MSVLDSTKSNLPPESQAWADAIQREMADIARDISLFNAGKTVDVAPIQARVDALRLELSTLGSQFAAVSVELAAISAQLAANQVSLDYVTAALDSMSWASENTKRDSRDTAFALSNGWYSGTRPSVVINSPYTRALVTFGGKGTFGPRLAFSATGYDRNTVVNNVNQGNWLPFGLNFPGSAQRRVIVDVTPNVNRTFTLEIFLNDPSGTGLGSMEGCYIQVEPIP